MEEILKLQELTSSGFAQLSIIEIMFNFAMCMIMAFIIKIFYVRYSYSLTGKIHIASIMPILAGVIFLVIVIVKSSLALSLGLVGALSIVRFRTPIKEPEELVYLFLIIAIGLGYGAGYVLETTVIVSSILAIIYLTLSFNKKSVKTNEYNLVIDWKNSDVRFESLITIVSEYTDSIKLIRLDSNKNMNTAVLVINLIFDTKLDDLLVKLQSKDEDLNVTFFEAKTNW
ncbi:MAG: Unknown protein [uncultured Sulfurovum sp.]|uniref:DUF4956 domain-containing protein n=1 Tax=uncultured Sulfurovum sp. TaxID=269237 RepID=A0A6S6T9Q7_9BACT|nr:MAG: Unknown protein [uncultured Sulfurovum sp.]